MYRPRNLGLLWHQLCGAGSFTMVVLPGSHLPILDRAIVHCSLGILSVVPGFFSPPAPLGLLLQVVRSRLQVRLPELLPSCLACCPISGCPSTNNSVPEACGIRASSLCLQPASLCWTGFVNIMAPSIWEQCFLVRFLLVVTRYRHALWPRR